MRSVQADVMLTALLFGNGSIVDVLVIIGFEAED